MTTTVTDQTFTHEQVENGKPTVLDTSKNTVEIPELLLIRSVLDNHAGKCNFDETINDPDWHLSEPRASRPLEPPQWIANACVLFWDHIWANKSNHPNNHKTGCSGSELVTEIVNYTKKTDRRLASGVWQIFLEENAIKSCLATDECVNTPVEIKYIQFCDDAQHFYQCSCPENTRSRIDEDKDVLHCSIQSNNVLKSEEMQQKSLARPRLSLREESVEIDRLQLLIDRIYGLASDAAFRHVLLKPPSERTDEDLEFVYHELSLIPSFNRLSKTVRIEMSKCIHYEIHPEKGSVIFRQGDPGESWYIIHRGSVLVHVKNQGVVCRLSEGDDFGKLALVTGSPRAATIILAEDNCHFLRVEKNDFDRILLDVEANTVRLKEGDSDVLILERTSSNQSKANRETSTGPGLAPQAQTAYKFYTIVSGTFEMILQHILEVRLNDLASKLDSIVNNNLWATKNEAVPIQDTIQLTEDFCLTYSLFTNAQHILLCLREYLLTGRIPQCIGEIEADITFKKSQKPDVFNCLCNQVLVFLHLWQHSLGTWRFSHIPGLLNFLHQFRQLTKLYENTTQTQIEAIEGLITDSTTNVLLHSGVTRVMSHNLSTSPSRQQVITSTGTQPLKPNAKGLHSLLWPVGRTPFKRVTAQNYGSTCVVRNASFTCELNDIFTSLDTSVSYYLTRLNVRPNTLPITESEHVITYQVYLDVNKTKVEVTVPVHSSTLEIKQRLSPHLSASDNIDDLSLVEVLSNGQRTMLDPREYGACLGLSPNGCLFLSSKTHLNSLAPLPNQLRQVMEFLEQTESNRSNSEGKTSKPPRPSLRRTASTSQAYKPVSEYTVEEIAAVLTYTGLQLAVCIGIKEMLDYNMGSRSPGNTSPHLRLLVSHFNLIHVWSITQIVTTTGLNKRAKLIRKLIKLANRLIMPPFCDQHHCFAIVLGLQSAPITRLTHTWERVPLRWRRLLQDRLVPLVDPSRNHRGARQWLISNDSGCLPFLALILKDLRFAEDANKTLYKSDSGTVDLINFEKMRLLARSLRQWNLAIRGYDLVHTQKDRLNILQHRVSVGIGSNVQTLGEALSTITPELLQTFYEGIECIDDLRLLTHLSLRLEPTKSA